MEMWVCVVDGGDKSAELGLRRMCLQVEESSSQGQRYKLFTLYFISDLGLFTHLLKIHMHYESFFWKKKKRKIIEGKFFFFLNA